MTQTLIGLDYEGVPAIKITRDDIDPGEEPDENVGSFLYNSKWSADIKLTAIDSVSAVGGTQYIGGGSQATYKRAVLVNVGAPDQLNWYRNSYFADLLYTLPLYDVKHIRLSNNRFVGHMVHEWFSGYGDRGGNWFSSGRLEEGWLTGLNWTGYPFAGVVGTGTFVDNYLSAGGGSNEEFRKRLVVWQLPGDQAPILDGEPQAPVEDAHVIEIDDAGVRVAKPGFDVRTATVTQLAFDSSHFPTKIIAADDVVVPGNGGVTSYDCGIELPANTVVEAHFYEGSTIYYPANPVSRRYGCEYWISGTEIFFRNGFATTCRARFYVAAYDGSAPTSGDNDIIRQFDEGGEDVVQILRPGASDDPSFADIIVDSRRPCLQMLAEGVISVGVGALTHTVNFDGTGMFPMVKYMTVHGAGSSLNHGGFSWSKRVRMPFMNICGNYNVGWTYATGGDSTYCTLTANQAVFRTFRGNPIRRYYNNLEDFNNNALSLEYDPSPIIAIRYFIFGIPAA